MKKRVMLLLTALMVSILLVTMIGGGFAGAAEQEPPGASWEASIKLQPEAEKLALQTRSTWSESLRQMGVNAGAKDGWLSMSGQKDMEQISTALFDSDMPSMDFLGGAVELTINLPSEGKPVTLNMEARNTTGYIWEVVDGDYAQNGEGTFTMRTRGVGVPAIQTMQFTPSRAGETSIRLIYHRPWESATEPHAVVTIQMRSATDLIELSDPTPSVIDGKEITSAENPEVYSELDELKTVMPASWDWRTQGIVPAVRNQGGCGSCWAFGTVSVMESAVAKGGGPLTDLSEQFLVSCNKDGWGCNGGLTATKYHYNTLALSQTTVGAVLEAAKPYTATDGSCTLISSHPYQASGWQFITGSEWIVPTVDQIKTAIYTYGPVTAGVCADNGWYGYTGGVYDPSSNVCGGYTNHQIVLVGWEDATSSWILRNSWGPNWGESGYMRIRWDTSGTTSRVGEGTSWVTYAAPMSVVPVLLSPAGMNTDTTPTFNWTPISGATQYRFQVYRGLVLRYSRIVPSSACSATECTDTPATVLASAAHKWRAQAYVGGRWKTFSAFQNFTVYPPGTDFDSQFNGTAPGWAAVRSYWRILNRMYYMSSGLLNKGASARHTGSYENMIYQVRMKRTGTCVNCANRIIVRGDPASLDLMGSWKPSYVFQYTNDGNFSVYEMTSTGEAVELQGWTISGAILQNDWNTLKVIVNGSSLEFYINDVLVWSGSDPTLTTGLVGFGFYRNTLPGILYVDWVNLTTLTPPTLGENSFDLKVAAPDVEQPGGSIDMSP